jgi:glycerol-3-phosphate O-acyltransferase / dihydroxyacetone phosphate acyltransferase
VWIGFCRLVSRVFYRTVEVVGRHNLPARGPAIVCANHTNALADVVVLQAASERVLHPLARSGLFQKSLLRPILGFIQAVPVYRAQDPGSDTGQNRGSFDRCFELLAAGGALVMFPEGVSHSEPALQPLKTGAARIALGSHLGGGPLPVVVPAGLTFVEKGRFRSRVLVQIGPVLTLDEVAVAAAVAPGEAAVGEPSPAAVREITARIDAAIRDLTLNAERWEDLRLLRQLERFFHFRRGRHPGRFSLERRFRTLQRMLRAHDQLRRDAPVELERLRRRLLRFERLRRLYRIEDYHLQARPELAPMAGRLIAGLLLGLALVGPAIWGLLTSGPAYALVAWWAPRASERFDQYDTNKIVLGIFAYGALWGVELTWFCVRFGVWPAGALFALSLPVAAAAGLALKGLLARLFDDARAFLVFRRRRDLQRYLLERRLEIEGDLAGLARRARSRDVRTRREACSV